LDVSCLVQQPLTGVGYAALHLVRALARIEHAPELRLFASGTTRPQGALLELAGQCSSLAAVRFPTRLKIPLWTRLGWPPLERFTGPVDIAHGLFHLLPPSRQALRVVTVYDLAALRFDNLHKPGSRALHRKLLHHAVRRADALIAASANTRRDLMELPGARPERLHVVPCGVDLAEFTGAFPQEALNGARRKFGIDGPYLLYLGTLEPRKNLVRLVEAYARVRERMPDAPRLVLAGGKGWLCDDVFETIGRLRLERHVVHTGYVTREEAVALLRGALGFVYPSRYEGFGLPVLEAMAARTPVLTSEVSSLPEVIGDGGVMVDPESVDSIAAGMVRLITDETGNRDRVARAFTRATRMTWDDSARALLGLYRRLLEGIA
jgi:glycosyltransferase involved in cell wall biosynthesis